MNKIFTTGGIVRKPVQQKSQIRQRLIAAYRLLSPLDQALVQLCSVIYEPTDEVILLRCFRRTGLTFSEGNLITVTDLEARINRLRARKLVNQRLQCHEAIVEVCSRDALNMIIASTNDLQPMVREAAPKRGKTLRPKTSRAGSRLAISPAGATH